MNFLSIDCSTDLFSLFIKVKSKSFNKTLQSDKFSNDLLMRQILDFFKENNLIIDNVDQIFINQGPGNFSGLRTSLAIAKGISLSKNLDLYGYDIFRWTGAKFFEKKDEPIFCFIKFREKYFVKKFNENLSSDSKIKEVLENDILEKYNNKFKIIPEFMKKQFSKKILSLDDINIISLDHNDLEFLKLKDLLDKDLIKPLYLI